jgi:hypothetical protein
VEFSEGFVFGVVVDAVDVVVLDVVFELGDELACEQCFSCSAGSVEEDVWKVYGVEGLFQCLSLGFSVRDGSGYVLGLQWALVVD